jgi:alpha-beta hydrolase superfamily lysophospholipase
MVPYRAFPSGEEKEVLAADGTALFVRRWPVPQGRERKGAALIVHGLGEHSGRYGHVAHVLNEAGLDVWAHDHRGFGKSAGKRAVVAHRDQLIDDTKHLFEVIRAEAGDDLPPLILGHSMGGAIVARAVTGGWIAPRAMMLSSPGLKSHINAFMRSIATAMEFVLPSLAVPHGLPLQYITHDLEVLADAASDPLNHALISARLTNFILEAGDAAIRDACRLTVTTLLQAAADDKLVDVSGAREFAAGAPAGLCTLKIYDDHYHEIYNEREPGRSAALADLKDWVVRVALR